MAPQVGQWIAVGIGGGAREGHLSVLVGCLILSGIDCWRRVDQDERLVIDWDIQNGDGHRVRAGGVAIAGRERKGKGGVGADLWCCERGQEGR